LLSAPAVMGAKGALGGGACACEAAMAAVAIGLGRKTTRRGPDVSERGQFAGWASRQAEAQQGSGEGGPKGGEQR
jgi:hypothetical protein